MAHFHWVIDPGVDDHDLSDYVCDPFAVPPNATCEWPMRNCTFDPHLRGHGGNASQWVCLHKGLLPFVTQDVFTAVLLGLCGILAGASGIGGGGLNVPILMLTSDFLFGEAVPVRACEQQRHARALLTDVDAVARRSPMLLSLATRSRRIWSTPGVRTRFSPPGR